MFIRVCVYFLWLLILASAGPILFQLGSNTFFFLIGHRGYDTYWSGYEHILYEPGPLFFSHYYCEFALLAALFGGIMLMLVAGQPSSWRPWERRVSVMLGVFAMLPGLLASRVLHSRVRMIIY